MLSFVICENLCGNLFMAAILCLFVVSVICASLAYKIKKILNKQERKLSLDEETGVERRDSFTQRFENDLSDYSREKYFLAYFLTDSNCLQVYYEDIPFSDTIKYLADTLSEFTDEYEFAGRVTESGFAMCFMSDSKEDAIERIGKIREKLNLFLPEGKKKKDIYYTALCHLKKEDRHCEGLLYNLRRNCVEIAGSRTGFVFCDSGMLNRVKNEKELETSIRQGIKKGEFKLYVQFIVDNKTKKITSAEALSRWENSVSGILLPGKYIPVMMRSGLIVDFDYYMFEQVCKVLEEWKGTALKDISLSCNFTRITISEDDFVERITEILGKYTFDRGKLTVEITEDAAEKNRERALMNIKECKKLGFSVALDDFGSGVTSPINFCEYPIDTVKIDRNVLLNTEKALGEELFKGLVALAHNLNMKVVCEGVETEKQMNFVSSTECNFIQGWYFSRAIPVQSGEEFVRDFGQA